jgi:hypothetical protein
MMQISVVILFSILKNEDTSKPGRVHFNRGLTTRAALVVIESPPKKNEPQMMTRKMIAPVPL